MDAILDFFRDLNPILAALYATLFTWGLTALGASLVFFFKTINQKLMDGLLGFTAGVMIAASFWSLLSPAIEMSSKQGSSVITIDQNNSDPAVKMEEVDGKTIVTIDHDQPTPSIEAIEAEDGGMGWVPAAVGFMIGAIFLFGMDKVMPHLHLGFKMSEAEGIKTTWHRSVLLVTAITLHNIPEGLAVGVAFGAAASVGDPVLANTLLVGAISLAIGIGLQNFPEGIAVAMPLRREGMSRRKSFMYGQLSAVVEPVAGVIGAAAVIMMKPILPYALSFAAGAMIFVVVEEVVPESHRAGNHDIATMGAMIGFVVMMVMDVSLG